MSGQDMRKLMEMATISSSNPRIAIAYEIITPESAEAGDTEERGWIDEEGIDMTPDKYDIEDGLTAVDKAVEFLGDEGSQILDAEASSSHFHTGIWYTAYDVNQDFKTSETENRSYHLYGFKPEEEEAIFQRINTNRLSKNAWVNRSKLIGDDNGVAAH